MARTLLIATAVVGLLLVALRERYDPRLSLYAANLLRPSPRPLMVPLDRGLALRLFSTTQPHIGKIASLQKGLVLVREDRSLIEEGYGFGLPIIEADGAAYLSRHAEVSWVSTGQRATLVKAYRIDVVDRPTQFLRVKYKDVRPLGTVVFSYTVRPPELIDVTVDFAGLEATWDRAYLMNEQGARAFTRYRDPAGVPQQGDEVGIWQEATAPFGCWEAPTHGVRFCVEASEGQPGFIGRERYNQYNWLGIYTLSWSGIDLQVEAPADTYTYTIRVERQASGRLEPIRSLTCAASRAVGDGPEEAPWRHIEPDLREGAYPGKWTTR
jgi:hypothetical protein